MILRIRHDILGSRRTKEENKITSYHVKFFSGKYCISIINIHIGSGTHICVDLYLSVIKWYKDIGAYVCIGTHVYSLTDYYILLIALKLHQGIASNLRLNVTQWTLHSLKWAARLYMQDLEHEVLQALATEMASAVSWKPKETWY